MSLEFYLIMGDNYLIGAEPVDTPRKGECWSWLGYLYFGTKHGIVKVLHDKDYSVEDMTGMLWQVMAQEEGWA